MVQKMSILKQLGEEGARSELLQRLITEACEKVITSRYLSIPLWFKVPSPMINSLKTSWCT